MDTIDEEVLTLLNLHQTAAVSDQTSTQLNKTLPLSSVGQSGTLQTSCFMGKKACDVCGQIFLSVRQLVKHQQYHDLNRPYDCFICEKRFLNRGNLKVHQNVHRNQRPFTYKICNRSFSSKHHLKSHMTIHTREEKYHCQQNNLDKHLPTTGTPAIPGAPFTPAPVILQVKNHIPRINNLPPHSNAMTRTEQILIEKKNLKKKQSMIDVIRNIAALPLYSPHEKPAATQHNQKFYKFRKSEDASIVHSEKQAPERVAYDIEVVL